MNKRREGHENELPKTVIMVDATCCSDPNHSNNGGDYIFYTAIDLIPGTETYEVHYTTSSDFEFCPYCGTFAERKWDAHTATFHCDMCNGETRKMTSKEVMELVDIYPDTTTEWMVIHW